MKILLITSDYRATQSGTGAHVQFLSGALRQLGVDVTIAAMPILAEEHESTDDNVLLHPQIGPKIVWHEQGGDCLVGGQPGPEWTVARQSQSNLGLVAGIDRDQRFDLIHFHGFRPAPAAVALGGIFSAPLVMTKHGSVLGIRLGPDVVVESIGGWSLFAGWNPFVLEYVRAVDRYALEHADRVIAVSEATRQDLLYDDAVAAKSVVIYNGSGLPECTEECASWRDDRPGTTIGVVGRLVPQKGIDILIESLSILGREDLRMRVAGNGPLLQPLRDQAEQLGVGERVEFMGILGRDRLHRFLHECDIVVAPSRWDALPQAVCDAQALGKLVIGSAVDGILEQIVNRKTGLLFSPGDASSLAAAITWSLDHPEEVAHIASAAAELGGNVYSWPDIAEQTLEVYKQVINEFRDTHQRADR
ncbi:glycosyltransferase family 4 protein [Amycolatopsis magusensis]|uniref:Glycogen(Starch) synthase n=1 Tax=Amycolatopsis magusensis TaxID=882444 RepID=A0ABS4PU34_9PSEU|nr:glycosyltransferase family 4 protein [Amycolatopsis magusensis]MBP2182943.1 glycogen(starch) synthase [Amycolatopsis magusensis]